MAGFSLQDKCSPLNKYLTKNAKNISLKKKITGFLKIFESFQKKTSSVFNVSFASGFFRPTALRQALPACTPDALS